MKRIKALAAIVFALITPGMAWASFAETSLFELADNADFIVVGTVAHKQTLQIYDTTLIEQLSLPANKGIVTLVTFEVRRSVGNPLNKPRIEIVLRGGTINGTGYDVSTEARLTEGKEYLLFICPLSKKGVTNYNYVGRFEMYSGSLGAFEIENNKVMRKSIFIGVDEYIPLEEAFLQIRSMFAH